MRTRTLATVTVAAMRGFEVFGPLRQNGYVVPDMASALEHWTKVLGIGPWHVIDPLPVVDFSYAGTPYEIDMGIALCQQGAWQLELIAQHDDTPSVYRDFLELNHGRGGLHHLAFWPDDMDGATAHAQALGWELGMEGRVEGAGWFRYFRTETPEHGGVVMELAQVQGAARDFWLGAEAERGLAWAGEDDGIIRRQPRR